MTLAGLTRPDDRLAGTAPKTASVDADAPDALAQLARDLGPETHALVILFLSPMAPLDRICGAAAEAFPGSQVIGCTTAGEISEAGYTDGQIVAIALPATHFGAEPVLVPDLSDLNPHELIGRLTQARQALTRRHGAWDHEFAFLLVDGLSIKEDELTAIMSAGLGPVPLFGGSAGDGSRFEATFLLHEGKQLQNAAILTFVRTDCPIKVFNLDHLVPTEKRMVVTDADPSRRIVRQINAEPAALEYARILGIDPMQLDAFTFAGHPVVVRFGGKHHVRSIQRIAENGDLVFFSAIDEGMVLTLAEPQNIAAHLEVEFQALSQAARPEAILACDCVLRRLEAEQKQMVGPVSKLLREHRVVGFSTYGEQLGAMHVNQTMTGVAFYPPGTRL